MHNYQIGDIVWTCRNSVEGEDYDDRPLLPWRGMIMEIQDGPRSLWISHTEEGGVPDMDSNATAICRANEVFSNEHEATMYYCTAMQQWFEAQLGILKDAMRVAVQFIRKKLMEQGSCTD